MAYAPSPESDDPEFVTRLALDNPMPRDLRDQIGNWIDPETVNCEADHGDVLDCIDIAYPLIRAYLAEHPDELVAHG